MSLLSLLGARGDGFILGVEDFSAVPAVSYNGPTVARLYDVNVFHDCLLNATSVETSAAIHGTAHWSRSRKPGLSAMAHCDTR